jgi:hypothetical protein
MRVRILIPGLQLRRHGGCRNPQFCRLSFGSPEPRRVTRSGAGDRRPVSLSGRPVPRCLRLCRDSRSPRQSVHRWPHKASATVRWAPDCHVRQSPSCWRANFIGCGESLFPRLDGEFALTLIDHRASRVYLVRDRIGMRPLFWTRLAWRSGVGVGMQDAAAAPEAAPAGRDRAR